MIPETRQALHEYLADATILVWRMQNALTENQGDACDHDLITAAEQLQTVSGVISGYVARWQGWSATGDRRGAAS